MKLTLIAIGSRGDVQPIVALGRGLVSEGYAVRLVTLESFAPMVMKQGLEFFPIQGDAQALTNDMMLTGMQGHGLNLLAMYRGIMRSFGALTEAYQQAFSAPALRDSSAILSQLPGGFYGYDLAEALGVPYIALSVIPQEITGAWALALLPSQRSFGAWYNRLTYYVGQQLAWQAFRQPINRFRQHLGLTPASFWWGNIRRMARQRIPVLQGFSPQVIPHQPEWGAHIHTTGYWTLDESDWTAPPALLEFLAAGDAPVFIGFGSMPVPNPAKTTELILSALAQKGKRGILHAGWAKLGTGSLPENVFALDYAPYAWLFPRMSAIVHHGGSGTTGLALSAGVPSLVIPFTADQPFWGARSADLGVAHPPIPFTQLSAPRLAHAIQHLTSDANLQANARRLRQTLLSENGIQTAVRLIKDILH